MSEPRSARVELSRAVLTHGMDRLVGLGQPRARAARLLNLVSFVDVKVVPVGDSKRGR